MNNATLRLLLGMVAACFFDAVWALKTSESFRSDRTSEDNYQPADMEDTCEFVSSRGIMKSCDVHPMAPSSDTGSIQSNDYKPAEDQGEPASAFLQEGSRRARATVTTVHAKHYLRSMHKAHLANNTPTVYVITTALPAFIQNVLPHVKRPFVLVTGDSDKGPPEVLGDSQFRELAANPLVLRWFAQNLLQDADKVERMPIGLDYHTLSAGDHAGWGPRANPRQQETELKQVRGEAPNFAARKHRVLMGPMSASSSRRMQIQSLLQANPSDFVDRKESFGRNAFWRDLTAFQYAASPVGNGVDCHRTWETLVLGGIPIVDKTGLNAVFKDNNLPYIEADDSNWGSLKELVSKASIKAPENSTPEPAVTLKYWVDKFRAAAKQG